LINDVKDEYLPEKEQLYVYPNPANDRIRIECYLPIDTEAKISLIDMLGQTKIDPVSTRFSSNTISSTELNIQSLENGIYFIVMEFNNQRIVNKLAIYR
jgi:hypothetical protein